MRLPCLLGQPQRLVGVGFGGARVTHATLVIGEVGEEHGTVFGDEVIVGEKRLEALPSLSHLAARTPEVDEMIGGAGRLRKGNLLQTIERGPEVRLLVAEPGEELRAPGTKYVPPSLLELIEVVPGMVIAQRLGTG